MSIRLLRSALAAAAALALLASPASAAPKKAFDYLDNKGLSETKYETAKTELTLPAALDGVDLYIEVVKPKAEGRYPVILEASPYHGTLADRDGTRIFPDPKVKGKPIGLTGYFAPRGYAVVMMDLRGTGKSRGCLDHLGPKDAADLKQVVEWAASQPWSNGKVGMTGHSYVGSTPSVAAAQNPKGLATIVPSAGLASMYHHQFQGGVPFNLQWAGVQWSYEALAIARKLPAEVGPVPVLGAQTGDDFGNNMEDTGCGAPQSSLVSGEDQLSGRYAQWHAERDHGPGATKADIPVFAVHGVNDNAARVSALDWFHARNNKADKLWLGQWDHGSGCCPNRRGMQWVGALHAWFDKHLAGRKVDTGPPIEAFLSEGTFEQAKSGDRDTMLTGDRWPLKATAKAFFPAADGTLAEAPGEAGSVAFSGDPRGFNNPDSTGAATFSTPAFKEDMVLVGLPKLDLSASVSVPRVHLIATLYEESKAGVRRRITQFALNPELRNGLDKSEPAVPGEKYLLKPEGFAMAQHISKDEKLVLRVTTSDPDKVPLFAVDPRITVFTGAGETKLTVPVIPSAAPVADNVPLK
jgi:putative CocE/NonD family hydrolase